MLKGIIKDLADFLSDHTNLQSLPLLFVAALLAISFNLLIGSIVEKMGTEFGIVVPIILFVIVFISLLVLLGFAKARRDKNETISVVPQPAARGEKTIIKRINSVAILKDVTENVNRPLFGDEMPEDNEVYASLNPDYPRSIAIWSETETKFVGYATIWPVSDTTAQRLLSGALKEVDMKATDILSGPAQKSANYAYIPGVAVLDALTPRGKRRGGKLILHFLFFILDTFFLSDTNRKSLTILAIGFTEQGVKLCKERFKMTIHDSVEVGGGVYKPIYKVTLTAKDLSELLKDYPGYAS